MSRPAGFGAEKKILPSVIPMVFTEHHPKITAVFPRADASVWVRKDVERASRQAVAISPACSREQSECLRCFAEDRFWLAVVSSQLLCLR